MSTTLRIALAEDDVLLREGLASPLECSGCALVGQAGTGPELLPIVRDEQPDIAVVDIRMPPDHTIEGLEAARAIRAEFPQIGLLLLSAHVEVEHARELLGSGDGVGWATC